MLYGANITIKSSYSDDRNDLRWHKRCIYLEAKTLPGLYEKMAKLKAENQRDQEILDIEEDEFREDDQVLVEFGDIIQIQDCLKFDQAILENTESYKAHREHIAKRKQEKETYRLELLAEQESKELQWAEQTEKNNMEIYLAMKARLEGSKS